MFLGGREREHWSEMGSMKKFPADNYMFKVNNRNTRTRSEKCLKLTIKTIKRRQ